jgi:hypothetical protein
MTDNDKHVIMWREVTMPHFKAISGWLPGKTGKKHETSEVRLASNVSEI